AEMAIIDQNSEWLGVPTLLLMENAGKSVAETIKSTIGSLKDKKIAIFAGTGNNGGDSFVAARHLAHEKAEVFVYLMGRSGDIRTEISKRNWQILQAMQHSITIKEIRDAASIARIKEDFKEKPDIIIDGLLGTGIRGKIREPISSAIDLINSTVSYKVSIDVPSGVDPLTGNIPDKAVKPDLTVTFHRNKIGLKNEQITGKLTIASIGVPPEAEFIVGQGDLNALRLDRSPNSHKGDFGKILVVGGSAIYSGAPALVALAAYRMGADLVQLLVPQKVATSIRSFSPNLIVNEYEEDFFDNAGLEAALKLLEWANVLAIGPGMGPVEKIKNATLKLLQKAVEKKIPMVMDADGLKAVKGNFIMLKGAPVIITPHLGEFRLITENDSRKGSSLIDKIKSIHEFTKLHEITCILKGPEDIICNGSRLKINITGTPAMTVGGTGDVLTGICSALLARNIDPFTAACCAAFINGRAGELAVETMGGCHLMATDLIDFIPDVMSQ
ncbi:MAG: NAD(P)H-hydrate dehydratase, partial [Candidatus Helarchaeales archaeon]